MIFIIWIVAGVIHFQGIAHKPMTGSVYGLDDVTLEKGCKAWADRKKKNPNAHLYIVDDVGIGTIEEYDGGEVGFVEVECFENLAPKFMVREKKHPMEVHKK